MIRVFLVGLLLLLALVPVQASATHFYSTRAEQALEALITTNSLCCSIARLYTHGGTLIGRLPTADGTVGQALTTNGAGTWSFSTIGPVGGAVGGSGTATHLARFTAAQTIGDATVTETAGALAAITTINMSSQLTSTLATGTPPFVVASTTNVVNLNASSLNGATFAAPGAIGGGTPSTAAFTTVTGTSFQGIIGNVTPAAGTFTTVTANTSVTTPSVIFATTNTIGIPSDTTLTFNAANVSGATALVLSRATMTQTSGTNTGLSLAGTFAPVASSTMIARSLYINPTINYSAGGAGSYCTLCVDVVETALPSGSNFILRFRAGAAGTTDKFAIDNSGNIRGPALIGFLNVAGSAYQQIAVGALNFGGSGSYIIENANGVLQLTDAATTGFTRLQFGGTSSAYPSLVRDGNALKFSRGDGTAVTFATLGTPAAGSIVYCSDCDAPAAGIMATCTSAGAKTGAWAHRVNTTPVWGCIGI